MYRPITRKGIIYSTNQKLYILNKKTQNSEQIDSEFQYCIVHQPSSMDFRKLLRVPVTKFGTFFLPRFRGTPPSFTAWRTLSTKGPNGDQNGDKEALKQQELNTAYDLGKMKLDLKMMINDDTITTLYDQDCELAVYKEYQDLASKFNIALEDPPLGKINYRDKMQTFFSEQIGLVEKYISKNKPNNIGYLYKAAVHVEKSRRILEISMNDINGSKNNLVYSVKNIKEAAQNLDVRIDDELNQLENSNNFDTGCLNRIKTKLCKVKPTVTRSEIDPTRIITNEYWAVSLVRLHRILHGDHVFLVLEGKTDDKSMIWFADFVAPDDLFASICSGLKKGRVRINSYEEEDVGAPIKLLYRCNKKMMKVEKGSSLLSSTWSISKSKADLLIANLKKQQKDPPKYRILANNGHNCFTFAKTMLDDLNDECIQLRGKRIGEWTVYAAATRHPSKNQRWITLWLRVFAATPKIAHAFLRLIKLFNYKN